jgi:CHAT domain
MRARRGVCNQQGGGLAVVPAGPSSVTTTLAYHIVGDDVLAFVQHAGDVTFHRLAGAVPAVDRELGRLNAQWSRLGLGDRFTSRHGSALVKTARTSLAALYDHLVAPLGLPDPPGRPDRPGLVIVPHHQLHHVPFHALHDGADHLCRRWPITIAPTVPGEPPTWRARWSS